MRIIVKDFIRRWWWVFVLLAGYVPGVTWWHTRSFWTDIEPLLALAGPLLLFLDLQQGHYTAQNAVPISARAKAAALWVESVLLLPVWYGLLKALSIVLIHVDEFSPRLTVYVPVNLYEIVVFCLIAMGISSWMLIALTIAPVEENAGVRARIRNALFTGLIIAVAVPILGYIRPSRPVFEFVTAPWVFLALSSMGVAYLSSYRIMRPAPALRTITEPAVTVPVRLPSRRRGFLEPWMEQLSNLAVPFILMVVLNAISVSIALIPAIQRIYSEETASGKSLLVLVEVVGYFAAMVFCIVSVLPWLQPVRVLRTLPMSRGRLVLYLFSFGLVAVLALDGPWYLVKIAMGEHIHNPFQSVVVIWLFSCIALRFGPGIALASLFSMLQVNRLVALLVCNLLPAYTDAVESALGPVLTFLWFCAASATTYYLLGNSATYRARVPVRTTAGRLHPRFILRTGVAIALFLLAVELAMSMPRVILALAPDDASGVAIHDLTQPIDPAAVAGTVKPPEDTGYVTAEDSATLFNAPQDDSRNRVGFAGEGTRIKLADRRAVNGILEPYKMKVPMIKVEILSTGNSVPRGTIAWIEMFRTSFAGYYSPLTRGG